MMCNLFIASVVLWTSVAGLALAQPAGRREGPPPGEMRDEPERSDAPAWSVEQLRERLHKGEQDAQRVLEAFRGAKQKLDQNVPAPEVLRGLFREMPLLTRVLLRAGEAGDAQRMLRTQRDVGPRGPMERGPGEQRGPDDGPGGPGGPGMASPPREMTEQDRAHLQELIKAEFPRLAKRLDQAQREGDGATRRLLGRVWPRMRGVLEVKASDPELYKQRLADVRSAVDMLDAIQEYRAAKMLAESPNAGAGVQEALTAARGRLREALRTQGKLRLDAQERDAAKLESRVGELRTNISKARGESDKLLDAAMEHIDAGEGPRDLFGPLNPELADHAEPGPGKPPR